MGWTVYNSDGQILQGSSTLADDAVTTAKILDANVTLAKMATNSVDSNQYVDGSIETVHIDDLQVTGAKMANDTITEGKLDVSNAPQNGYFLQAQSGEGGGLTWAEVSDPAAASTTTAGIAELAIAGEVNTGTSAALAVTPDSLAGSIYGEVNIQFIVVDWGVALTTGAGKHYFYVPATLNGFHVVSAHAAMVSAPAGSAVLVDISKVGIDDIFTDAGRLQIAAGTIVSIDSGSGAWALDSTHKILATGQILRVDIDQVGSSTAGSGLYINLTCRRP